MITSPRGMWKCYGSEMFKFEAFLLQTGSQRCQLNHKDTSKILRYLKAEYTLQWAYKDLDSYPSSAIKFVCSVSYDLLLLQQDKCYTEALKLD